MKYGIDYKFLPKGASKLEEIGTEEDIELNEENFGLIPNVGDYVSIPGDRDDNRSSFRGRVHHRYFRYVLGMCYVSIVLEETDDATWASLGRG